MLIEVLKSKIHRVTVTDCDLNYIGSITIDEALIEAGMYNTLLKCEEPAVEKVGFELSLQKARKE